MKCLEECQQDEERGKKLVRQYHEAKIAPLAEKVTVYIDAVWFTQILRYESSNRWKVLLLQ